MQSIVIICVPADSRRGGGENSSETRRGVRGTYALCARNAGGGGGGGLTTLGGLQRWGAYNAGGLATLPRTSCCW